MAYILLVDDDPLVVARNAAAFAASGHFIATAPTTAEALAMIAQKRPDAVVLEAVLDGGRAGLDLARRLARDFPGLPLVMLTRLDDQISEPERERQDRDGGWLPVQRFMEKPVMPEVLVYEVEHAMGQAA